MEDGNNFPKGGIVMTLREIMTTPVVRIRPEETAAVAARLLAHYNVGALPVCGNDGKLCGLVTDRDLVVRCIGAGLHPASTKVGQIMSTGVYSARPDMDAVRAAQLMGRQQIRRLPVTENGKLCGMVSLGDLAAEEGVQGSASEALKAISSRLSSR